MKKIIFAILALAVAITARAEYAISCPGVSGLISTTADVKIYLTGDDAVYSFQLDITPSSASLGILPADIKLNAEVAPQHTLQAAALDDGRIRVLVYDTGGRAITPTAEDPIITIPVALPAFESDYELTFSRVILSTTEGRREQPGFVSLVKAEKVSTGVDAVGIDGDADGEWYDIRGIRYDKPSTGYYIHRRGANASKELHIGR